MDTPFIKRAYNLGLKAVPNFLQLSEDQIAFYEAHLDEIPAALCRGFALPIADTKPAPEPPLDFLIHVDRSVRPSYPDWAKHDSVNNPGFVALEATGPADYDLSTVEQYLYGKQKTGGYETGNAVLSHLKSTNALPECYGLADFLAIQAKCNQPGGIRIFRALFKGKAVFGWKSVVEDQNGDLLVPCLVENDGEVVLGWYWLDRNFRSNNPALRFRK